MNPDQATRLATALRITNYLEDVVTLVRFIGDQAARVDAIRRPPAAQQIADYETAILTQVGRCDTALSGYDIDGLDASYHELRALWHELKSLLLDAALQRRIPLEPLYPALDALRSCVKVAERLETFCVGSPGPSETTARGTGAPSSTDERSTKPPAAAH